MQFISIHLCEGCANCLKALNHNLESVLKFTFTYEKNMQKDVYFSVHFVVNMSVMDKFLKIFRNCPI